MSVSLPSLFRKALLAASKAHDLPTIDDETQDLIQSSLSDMKALQSRIEALSLFSSNEVLEDISTKDLIYLLVPYVTAQVVERVKTTERDNRLTALSQAERLLRSFLELLNNYDIASDEDRQLYKQKTHTVTDPAKRRELKIKQYQKVKDLRSRVEAVAKRRNQTATLRSSPSEFDLILSLLPSEESSTQDDHDEDDTTSDAAREATLLLLRLAYTQAHSQLENIDQELKLLRSAPPPPPLEPVTEDGARRDKKTEHDDMWRLESPIVRGGPDGKGPLLDPSGKPLRPFTILPAGASQRARLQAQVFRPDHNLPTMTIDEYLQIENEWGNILTGGGPASENAITSSEQLRIDAEQDGTLLGEEHAEKKRQKDENWALFTEANPKGAGNTMNRG